MTLHEYLEKYELSQKQAAAKFGISEAAMSRILSKERNPGNALKEVIKLRTKGAVDLESWA